MEALRDIPGFFLALALALLLDCILSAREVPTGPQVRTSVRDKSVRDKSVRDKHSQVCQVPKNDDQPDGTAFTAFYIILAPHFICRPKYKSKDESKGVDFKNYNNTFGCTKVKGEHIMCVQQKSTAVVIYVEVWGVCKGNANRVCGTAYAKVKTAPVTCGERRKRWSRGDGKWCVPLCQYRRSRGQGV
ncbi:hypothetical protein B0H14DRAFT_2571602 [Mycena olivaceomarginata]|nr:hypothetical protein B0H14DRAFT_2571602 [Mycena olivaceomarginata]